MPVLPTITFTQLCKIVEKMEFNKTRQKGSHIRYVHIDGRKTTIPDHGGQDVPKGLLIKIIKQDLNISVDDFVRFM
ncbi:MAG: type II toxin-antitoxin system HicA family toxin [Methylobacter sp.]|nr:type II toxin-antitoxin system HicA family toxin [Methylobacter sp.]